MPLSSKIWKITPLLTWCQQRFNFIHIWYCTVELLNKNDISHSTFRTTSPRRCLSVKLFINTHIHSRMDATWLLLSHEIYHNILCPQLVRFMHTAVCIDILSSFSYNIEKNDIILHRRHCGWGWCLEFINYYHGSYRFRRVNVKCHDGRWTSCFGSQNRHNSNNKLDQKTHNAIL